MINSESSIIKYPDKKLFLKSHNVIEFDSQLLNIIDTMKCVMIYNNGVGLAAIQIGILQNICLIIDEKNKKILEFINPVIIKRNNELVNDIEGCLSIPNVYNYVSRPYSIKVQAYNKKGVFFTKSFFGLNARILCHEIDHLNGILFIQHVKKENTI